MVGLAAKRMARGLPWALALACWAAAWPAQGEELLVELELAGKKLVGTPTVAGESLVLLLGRDGQLARFAPQQAQNFRQLPGVFQPFSSGELRAQLMREFGGAFDVSGTGHYLVVHPAGERDLWADRFEELYRSFMHYFTARGLKPRAPRFPLVAVVMPTRQHFLQQAQREGAQLNAGVLGYYSPTSNRVLMYDESGPRVPPAQWHRHAETIIHEATHQTAFNTGLHSRHAMPPRWVCEGLATMFEAPGVWDSRSGGERAQRVNTYQLGEFRKFIARRPKGTVAEMIASDDFFRADPGGAYAQAWAFTFFLAETEPRKYGQYLVALNNRSPQANTGPTARVREFAGIFGEPHAMLEARFLRFLAELK